MKRVLLLSMTAMLLLQSCATIIAPVNHNRPVKVNVPEYEVYVNGILMGDDLDMVMVNHKDVVTIKKDGYKPKTVIVQGKFNGWVIGNLLFGGLIGGAVDLLTDNAMNLKQVVINAKLDPIKKDM